MAISKLYRLNKVNDKNKSSKNVKKFDKAAKSKPNKKIIPTKHTPGPSSADNKKVSVDSAQLTKVIEAFKKREANSNSSERDLLDESSGKYVFLQFRLSKVPPEPHVKPLQIQLKHPIYSGKDVCVLVKDPQKTWKAVISELKIPEIKKVIGVGKVRKKYKKYEDKRVLCNSFDLFLCDKSVVPSIPSLLGSYFIEKKKLPVGVNFAKNKIKNSFLTAINSTYYKLSQGSYMSVKVGTYSMPTDHIIENIMNALESVKKFHTEDEVFKNHICSVLLNWGGSDSLPLYSEELLEIDKINDAAKTSLLLNGANVRRISTQTSSETVDKTDASDAGDLVKRIYYLARSGQTNVDVWRDCTLKTIESIYKLDLRGLVSILHSYGYMKYRDKNMLQLISARLIENIRLINSSQITSVLKAYSILNFRSDFLFRMMIPEISLRLDMMTVNQVSSVFYSYSNLGYYNKNLFQTIQTYLYSNVDKLTPYDLTLLLSGFCKNFKGFDDKFLTVLSFQFCKLLNAYDNKLFSLSVNSLSRLNFCKHKYLPSVIESEVYNRVKSPKDPLASRSLSLILNSLSKHYTSCTPLFTFLSQTVLKRLKEFDMHSVCLVLSSFSRVSLSDGKTYDKIAEYVGRNSLKLYPRAIASMLYSYARAKHLHGALFYFSGKHIQLNLGSYSCDEVAMVLRSFSVLNVKNEELLDSFSKFILENTPDYVPIKFEDLCPHLRVSFGYKESDNSNTSSENKTREDAQKTVADNTDDKTDLYSFEGRNINMLEYVGEASKISSNYLSNGKMHSLLWIVQAYAKFFYINDNVTRAMTRIANELVVRMNEMTPFLVSRLLFSFSQLNFRHEAVLEMLLNEVTNPRVGLKFTQKELSLLHYSIPTFGLDPGDFGIYKFKALDFKRMVESTGLEELILRIVNQDIPSSKPLFLELLNNPLTMESLLKDKFNEGSNNTMDLQEERVVKEFEDKELDGSDIYIHIPEYLKELVKSDNRTDDMKTKLEEALDNHVNYNFKID